MQKRAVIAVSICVLVLTGCESLVVTRNDPGPPYPAPPAGGGPEVVYQPPALYPVALNIPKGHLPPPGSCRIWYPDRPPGQQPPPGDCYQLAAHVPPGAWLLSRPPKEDKHVHVSVYDQSRPGAVVVVRVFEAATGRFLHDQPR